MKHDTNEIETNPVADVAAVDVTPVKRAARAVIVVPVATGRTPAGFADIRAAVRATGINRNTDESVTAIRADIATVSAAMPSAPMPTKSRGRFTAMRTYDFQNTLYAVNDRADWRFTDRTLLVIWAVELASNAADFAAGGIAHYIGGTRAAYTRGKHGTNVVDPTVFTSRPWPLKSAKPAKS